MQKSLVDGAAVVQQHLRLDAFNVGRVQQQLQQVTQQPVRNLNGLRRIAGYRIGVPNHRLVPLVHAKSKAAHAPTLKRNKARQDTRVQILQQQLAGALVAPAQPLLPHACLVFQQRTQLARRKMP